MQTRFPRTVLAMSAAIALAAAALAPTAAFAAGPGPGAGDCDGDCTADGAQAQQQVRARAGNGDGQGYAAQGRGGRNQVAKSGAGRGWDEDQPRGPEACEECEAEMGTLDDDQVAELIYMAYEEKLAHDVYAALGEQFDAHVFERISASEARHQLAVNTVLTRYGIEDPAFGLEAGEFGPEAPDVITTLWAELMEPGPETYEEALSIGVLIEETDIADLEAAMTALVGEAPDTYDAPDVYEMYSHLLAASNNHLAAFQGQL